MAPLKDRLRSGRAGSRRSLELIVRHRYVTDGTNLYRFVGWGMRKGFAELEDCRSLDLLVVSARELLSQRIRPVAPAQA
ncbi:MAG TPA: hypothetical protein VGY13_13330 [Solirubrobacteraceae bacterium]|jgi:hypothetical protein|nr:hypothetical protein [Solirubrobacteraceae bacterium]